jgi:hypothetical protein
MRMARCLFCVHSRVIIKEALELLGAKSITACLFDVVGRRPVIQRKYGGAC